MKDILCEARRVSFSSIYANYADIFYHRSMEKDKLSILDVWGAYGQKDNEKLDRSEMNKPESDNGDSLSKRKQFLVSMLVYANYTDIFYHRSMEKDNFFVLDVCGAYGQKDIEILDRSFGACMPCRSRLSDERKTFETLRSYQFDIKKVGIQTNKSLNWHHGGYIYRFISHIFKTPFYTCGDEGAIN